MKGFTLEGETILPRDTLMKKINIKPGDIFSRQVVIDSEKAVNDALGDKGYLFAVVSLQPDVDEKTKQVSLTFIVKPGKRVYVRHIYFSDNTRTNDIVLRREVQQMESAPVASDNLDQSKHRLSLLPFVRDVQMTVDPVPDTDDTVDIHYKITEDPAAQATFSVGYSQLEKLILSAGVTQKNFLGTGKTVGLNASRSRFQQFLGINYTDPYYTPDGISRTINLSASKFDPRGANISRSYTDDQYTGSVIYGIPLGQEQNVFTNMQLGFGYQETLVKLSQQHNNLGQLMVSNQIQNFVSRHGRHFQEINFIAGISRDSRDKAIFPTVGMIHTLAGSLYAPATSKSLKYYTVAYNTRIYRPITGAFIATGRMNLAYGNSFGRGEDYPFFNDFYSGGMDSVRGYEGNTLGPKDNLNDSTGGNLLGDVSLGLIFPNHISDNVRTTLFVDGGNVYNTFDNRKFGGTASGPLRYSSGIEADCLVPGLGLIDVAVSKAINPRRGDDRNWFQFSLGANFG